MKMQKLKYGKSTKAKKSKGYWGVSEEEGKDKERNRKKVSKGYVRGLDWESEGKMRKGKVYGKGSEE